MFRNRFQLCTQGTYRNHSRRTLGLRLVRAQRAVVRWSKAKHGLHERSHCSTTSKSQTTEVKWLKYIQTVDVEPVPKHQPSNRTVRARSTGFSYKTTNCSSQRFVHEKTIINKTQTLLTNSPSFGWDRYCSAPSTPTTPTTPAAGAVAAAAD